MNKNFIMKHNEMLINKMTDLVARLFDHARNKKIAIEELTIYFKELDITYKRFDENCMINTSDINEINNVLSNFFNTEERNKKENKPIGIYITCLENKFLLKLNNGETISYYEIIEKEKGINDANINKIQKVNEMRSLVNMYLG
jgi:beta-xylosidase